ncbi:MAG: glycosyltransferase [Hyphomicrobiales bacterium]|nr:glycosyltransferase [Hyphomicrobiales bacterium]
MRVLFSSMRMIGHLRPLFPYADILLKRGHHVLFAAPHDAGATIRDAGFDHAEFGHPGDTKLGEISGRFATMTPDEVAETAVREIFVGLNAPAALPGLRSIIGSWGPDVVVRESMEFGASLAAAETGIPTARVASSNMRAEAKVLYSASIPLDAIRQKAGIEPDSGASLRAEPSFTSFPPSMDGDVSFAGLRTPFRVRAIREMISGSGDIVPSWAIDDGRPLVFITFGTLAAGSERNHRLFRIALEAVGALPVRALFSTGAAMDLAGLGDVPENVTVTSWVNQREVFPRASVLICHGGAGTVLAGLAHGIPMVVTPISADQPSNARLVEEAGAGSTLIQPAATSLRAAIERALYDPEMRSAAARVAHEMSVMPSIDDAVREIERLNIR